MLLRSVKPHVTRSVRSSKARFSTKSTNRPPTKPLETVSPKPLETPKQTKQGGGSAGVVFGVLGLAGIGGAGYLYSTGAFNSKVPEAPKVTKLTGKVPEISSVKPKVSAPDSVVSKKQTKPKAETVGEIAAPASVAAAPASVVAAVVHTPEADQHPEALSVVGSDVDVETALLPEVEVETALMPEQFNFNFPDKLEEPPLGESPPSDTSDQPVEKPHSPEPTDYTELILTADARLALVMARITDQLHDKVLLDLKFRCFEFLFLPSFFLYYLQTQDKGAALKVQVQQYVDNVRLPCCLCCCLW